jgi:hypothetical protein
MISQKDAVHEATLEILRQANIELAGRAARDAVPREIRKLVTLKLLEYVDQGRVKFSDSQKNSSKFTDRSKMTAYLSGLIANHWKRDKRLNGKGK